MAKKLARNTATSTAKKRAAKKKSTKKKAAKKKAAKKRAAATQPRSKPPRQAGQSKADRHREMARRRSREQYAADSELGELPLPLDPDRRTVCEKDLWEFIHTYCVDEGNKPLSEVHRRMIAFLQDCILEGGFYAQAMPRGFAKTTIGILAICWAVLYGHRRYIVLFGYDWGFAEDLLGDVMTILSGEVYPLLEEDFPEVILPLMAIDDKPQRAKSQKYQGKKTGAVWENRNLQTATIDRKEYPSVGVRVVARPRDNARGLRKKMPDGTMLRPDLFLADDIQTDGSAASPKMVAKQLSLIRKSWMLLTGHHESAAGIINGTILEPNDVMAQLTDPANKQYAVWQSQRIRLVNKWADRNDDLWLEEYAGIRSSYPEGEPGAQKRAQKKATAFYKKNRKAMDAGCDVTWEHCYSSGEISAIQHAYNLLIDLGEEAFNCECQNSPPVAEHDFNAPSPLIIIQKQHGLAPNIPPSQTEHVVAYIDQQDNLLYWLVAAYSHGLTGYVLNYGSWPDQQKSYYTLASAKRTLSWKYPGLCDEAKLHAGFTDLVGRLFKRTFVTPRGDRLRIKRLGIDTNYGKRTEEIRSWIEQSDYVGQIVAGFGRGITAKQRPLSEWPKRRGEERGPEWVLRRGEATIVQNLIYDTNYHKKHAIEGLALPLASPGSISLPKVRDMHAHEMLADHIAAEFGILVETKDRKVIEFETIPSRDNHLLDCLVGSRVVASTVGVRSAGKKNSKPKNKRRRKTRRSRAL